MRLQPLAEVGEPRYPTYRRRERIRKWLRLAAAAGATSMVFLLCGFDSCTPFRTAGEPQPVSPPEAHQLPGTPPVAEPLPPKPPATPSLEDGFRFGGAYKMLMIPE